MEIISRDSQSKDNLSFLSDPSVTEFYILTSITVLLEEAEDLRTSNTPDLGNTIGIPQDHTDLRRGEALLGKLAHMVLNVCA